MTRIEKVMNSFAKDVKEIISSYDKYEEYQNYSFIKKLFVKKPTPSRRSYLSRRAVIFSDPTTLIEIRFSAFPKSTHFSEWKTSIYLCINENGHGYMLDIVSGEKSYYLGRVNPTISVRGESFIEYYKNLCKEAWSFYSDYINALNK